MLDRQRQSTDTLQLDAATAAAKGNRDYQHDTVISGFAMGQSSGFVIIAGGRGENDSGGIASAITAAEFFCQIRMNDSALDVGLAKPGTILRAAAAAANRRLADERERSDDLTGMASTVVAPIIRHNRLSWLSVGNAPMFLCRNGSLRQLNKDHSMATQIDLMVKGGSMLPEVGRDHPDRNVLTSLLNGGEIAAIDCPQAPLALWPGDIIILGTDGLKRLDSSAILAILSEAPDAGSDVIARALLDALNNDDQGNVALAVIRLTLPRTDPAPIEADDLPVLASAEPDPPEPDPERQAYWYRGQKYYKD